jgi:hypothetical protein
MAKLFPIISGLSLAGLFLIALISFGFNVAENNNPSQTIGNDEALNSYYSNLHNNLTGTLDTANDGETALGQDPTTDTGDNLLFPSVKGTWKSLTEGPKSVYSLTIGLLISKLFSSDEFSVVFITIGGLLVIALIVAVWRWAYTGDGG